MRFRVPVHDELLPRFFVFDNTFIRWISRNVIFTVRVWIAVLPPFESKPKQERLFRRAWYDILHDIAHLELYTQSMDRSDNIRIICDPCTSKAATLC